MARYKAYVVTVGTQPGVYPTWLDAAERIAGVPGAQYQGFKTWDEAQAVFDSAWTRGKTRAIHSGLPTEHGTCRERSREPQSQGNPAQHPGSEARRAARDALIAAAFEEVKREKQRRDASSARESRPGVGSTPSRQTNRQPSAVPTQPPAQQTKQRPRAPAQRETVSARGPPPTMFPRNGPRSTTRATSSVVSTSSSPLTGVTVYEHGTSSASPVASPIRLRYAQSLSYASDAGSPAVSFASPATGSSMLAPSDRQSDLSSPATGVTTYFPANYRARLREAEREAEEGATHVSAARPKSVCTKPGMSTRSQAASLPALADTSLPAERAKSVAMAALPPVEPRSTAPTAATRRKKIGKSYSDAAIQVDRASRTRAPAQAAVQTSTASTPKQHASAAAQIPTAPSLRETPVRAAASAGAVLERDTLGAVCACEHPEHVCRACGLPARVMRTVASRPASPTDTEPLTDTDEDIAVDSPARPVAPLLASPPTAPAPTVRSARSAPTALTSFHSAPSVSGQRSLKRIHENGHISGGRTPVLGPSECAASSMASFENGMRVLVLASPGHPRDASGAAVPHDATFDPRSPLQRGTMVPTGPQRDGLFRPSPLLSSLDGLLFS